MGWLIREHTDLTLGAGFLCGRQTNKQKKPHTPKQKVQGVSRNRNEIQSLDILEFYCPRLATSFVA